MSRSVPGMPDSSATGQLPCPRCGKPVDCGMRAGRKTCWCFDLPHVLTVPKAEDGGEACLCEDCLRKGIAEGAANPVPASGPDRA